MEERNDWDRDLTVAAEWRGTDEMRDVALAATGDSAAFERIYRRHVGKVRGVARWLLGSGEDDLDDVVQEIFVRVWKKLTTYRGDSAFGTWLHRVAVNQVLRYRQNRAVWRGRHISDEVAMERALAPSASGMVDARVSLERAVAALPAKAREVFVLHDVTGFTHEEIAEQLGIDPGTSRSQLHRARMLLRNCL